MLRTLELPRDDRAPALARRALAATAADVDPGLVEDARLIVSELVTNSVRYGAGDEVRLRIEADEHRGLRCEVRDAGSGFVPRLPEGRRDAGGWGLQIVNRLADRWGVGHGSTHVWFELAVGPDRHSTASVSPAHAG